MLDVTDEPSVRTFLYGMLFQIGGFTYTPGGGFIEPIAGNVRRRGSFCCTQGVLSSNNAAGVSCIKLTLIAHKQEGNSKNKDNDKAIFIKASGTDMLCDF